MAGGPDGRGHLCGGPDRSVVEEAMTTGQTVQIVCVIVTAAIIISSLAEWISG